MEEKNLNFDRQKHVCYSKQIKEEILTYLNAHLKEEEISPTWESIQLQYVDFLKDQPYLGGKKCTHNGPGGTYDCIALFAMYEVLENKPSLDEMEAMLNAVFVPPFARLGKILNVNNSFFRKLMSKIFTMVSKKDKKLEDSCPTGYIMEVEPYDKGVGVRYQFKRCPIAEFAKAHGYVDIMPAFCNGDYPCMEAIHAGLIRKCTCSNSDHCDYWIVGDKSEYLKKYPAYKDDKGFIKN